MSYITRDRETGTIIDEFKTLAEAEQAIEGYEAEDRRDGHYTPDFYEISKKGGTA